MKTHALRLRLAYLMRRFLFALLFIPLFTPSALAEEDVKSRRQGYYGVLGGGPGWSNDQKAHSDLWSTRVDTTFKDSSTGWGLGLGIGKYLGNVRAEVGYGYGFSSGGLDEIKICGNTCVSITEIDDKTESSSHTLTLSGYYDFLNKSKFTPYLGAGIGYSMSSTNGKLDLTYDGVTETVEGADANYFSYMLGGGVSYQVSRETELFSEVYHIQSEATSTSGFDYDPATAWGTQLGIRYKF